MKTDFFRLKSYSTEDLRQITKDITTEWFFLQIKEGEIEFLPHSLERFLQVAEATKANMLYSNYYQEHQDLLVSNIEYQRGSLRDDFDFGALVLLKASVFKEILNSTERNYRFAGFYDMRLRMSQKGEIFHIEEPLYLLKKRDEKDSSSQHFEYVDRKNRDTQIEMEEACTQHLRLIGALLDESAKEVDFSTQQFDCEVSVIIPVRNREKTTADAIISAVRQKTNFKFNVLIVNNHSTDNTGNIISQIEKEHSNVFQIIPQNRFLGIGGCWNVAINSEKCGKFAIQLDSDDVYESENTLQMIVDEFYRQRCAMLIGSYTITDYMMRPIPPYLINHSEWTDTNGPNNALRINGLGAPRAFFTPIIRQIGFPNVSYGEDYAVGLRISREWKIGRIYESIYLCRRWESNSDSSISQETMNRYNFYKDKIRTIELLSRIENKNHSKPN